MHQGYTQLDTVGLILYQMFEWYNMKVKESVFFGSLRVTWVTGEQIIRVNTLLKNMILTLVLHTSIL